MITEFGVFKIPEEELVGLVNRARKLAKAWKTPDWDAPIAIISTDTKAVRAGYPVRSAHSYISEKGGFCLRIQSEVDPNKIIECRIWLRDWARVESTRDYLLHELAHAFVGKEGDKHRGLWIDFFAALGVKELQWDQHGICSHLGGYMQNEASEAGLTEAESLVAVKNRIGALHANNIPSPKTDRGLGR